MWGGGGEVLSPMKVDGWERSVVNGGDVVVFELPLLGKEDSQLSLLPLQYSL